MIHTNFGKVSVLNLFIGKKFHDDPDIHYYCFNKSKKIKGRKTKDINKHEEVRQQELLIDLKTEEKYKTKEKETKGCFNQIKDYSDFKHLEKNHNKDNKTKIKSNKVRKELSEPSSSGVNSNSLDSKNIFKKCKKKNKCHKKLSEAEASDNDLMYKMALEYAKNRKKSKKSIKQELREKHKSQSKQNNNLDLLTMTNVYPKVEGENVSNNRSGLSCKMVDKTPSVIKNKKKRKRKHSESENDDKTHFVSIKHKKRKHKQSQAEKDDKTVFSCDSHKTKKRKHSSAEKEDKIPRSIASNNHKKRSIKPSEATETGNLNNLNNREEDFPGSSSKHKKNTHRKPLSL